MVGFQKPGLQYGTYYSNQPSGGASRKSKFLIIGVIVLVLIALVTGVTTLLSNNAKSDISLLAVKENSLLSVSSEAQENISSDALRVANSNATILLTSDVTSLVTVTGIKKLPDGLVKQYVDTNGDSLKQAKLLDRFDSTYQKLVIQKVNDLISEAQTVESKTSNKTWRAEVAKALANLQSIKKQFEAL